MSSKWGDFVNFFKGAKVHDWGDQEITWETPPALCYPGKLTKAHYKVSCALEGVFEYEPGPGATLPIGDNELIVRFLPLDPEIPVKERRCKLTVTKAIPTVTWKQPLPITEGTGLNRKQLNAACINLPGGDYEYKPQAREKLTIGEHILYCTYSPGIEYSKNYDTVNIQIKLQVIPMEIPQIIWDINCIDNENLCPITYGTLLSSSNCFTATCPTTEGRFVYEPEENFLLQAGKNQNIRCTFFPSNRNKYKSVIIDKKLTVHKAIPVINWGPELQSIYYDTPLSETQLCATNDLEPNTHAIYTYTPSLGSRLPHGNNTLSVQFTCDPNIIANYEIIKYNVNINIIPKKIPLIIWNEFPYMQYGEEISRDNIANAKCIEYYENDVVCNNDVKFGGIISYEPVSGTILEPGEHEFTMTFIPNNTIEYDIIIIKRNLIINKAKPVIIWPIPSPMLKNLTLNMIDQLNAKLQYEDKISSRIKTKLACYKLGNLTYDPPEGTLFHAGEHQLSVKFTPRKKYSTQFKG